MLQVKQAPLLCAVLCAVQMVLNTSPDVGDLRDVMSYIYDEIFVEYVVKNPLYTRGTPFKLAGWRCAWLRGQQEQQQQQQANSKTYAAR
jgi:hypothetical protein